MLGKQGRYVLILDDVWSSFSLTDVGIPEPTQDNGSKLVLTTHSVEVGLDIRPDPIIESTMKLVVEECHGLLLAIVTVASCMNGKSDPLA
ncbi:hypothetical protein DITRI_Ditri01bG0145500 [Diplodiscus trichospermus]